MTCLGALDIALWDIAGKIAGRPICELLAERLPLRHGVMQDHQEIVPYGAVVADGWDKPNAWIREHVLEQEIARVVTLHEVGYRAIKVEQLRSSSQTVIEMNHRARAVLGPDKVLAVDVGYLWSELESAAWVAA
jgi:L-alanine-DL-glutamate epimerase-like enolase superfamily enzyme